MIYMRDIFLFFFFLHVYLSLFLRLFERAKYYREEISACREIKSRLIFLMPPRVRGREIVKSLSGSVSISLTSS